MTFFVLHISAINLPGLNLRIAIKVTDDNKDNHPYFIT